MDAAHISVVKYDTVRRIDALAARIGWNARLCHEWVQSEMLQKNEMLTIKTEH